MPDGFLNAAVVGHPAFGEVHAAGAEGRDALHVVRDEQHRAPALGYVLHFAEAPPLKLGVADGQHFVHNKYLRAEVGGDRKRQAHIHPRRVALDRRV